MSDTEAAWLAGLLEGEGSFLVWDRKTDGRTVRLDVVRVQMCSTDLDVLERVVEVTGLSRPRPIKAHPDKLGTKPIWQWSIQRKAEVRALTERLLPWLGTRRTEQAQAVLAATEGLVIREDGTCRNGHPITIDNRVRTAPGKYTCRICLNARRRRQAAIIREGRSCTEP